MTYNMDLRTLNDDELEQVRGGGLPTIAPGIFGFEAITLERGAHTPAWRNSSEGDPGRYVGETEKNVW